MARFFAGLASGTTEVRSPCRHTLQALAEAVPIPSPEGHQEVRHEDLVGASV